uniref:AT-rich interactive domain-containing protein 4B n=1 Tax=Cacopsylla melanoneura TaxID=428564 RepID=A0A8D8ZI51_9HEMI
MSSREVKKEKMGDDPPYLAVGTDVSAKYKGAFCEAKVRKVVRVVKCKVQLKYGGVAFVTDDQIKGSLRIGSTVEVKLPDKKDFVEASISNIKDLSQYTVVFDDGDITTLRRTALCLKSGRHFAESETLDQLPLTHPEHFSTPVMGASRRGRRGRGGNEDSSDDEDPIGRGGERQREVDIGKVVCVEVSEKKKTRDNWFPGLIVAPNAQDAVRIDVDEDYLVRSFKDGRYFTVPKKEATEFTRERGLKVDNPSLKLAVEKALQFLDKDELPPHWDRDLMFGLVDTDLEEDSDQMDSDSSDDEPREEKDHFVAQLYKFMDDRGTPINKGPVIQSRDVDLYRLFRVVHKLGGYNRVTNQNQWKLVTHKMGFGQSMSTVNNVKHAYKKFLHSFEDFYRKLGCTMVNHPRGNRRSNKSNRSLIRDKDRATPVQKESDRIRAEPGGSGVKTNTPGQKDADSSRGVKSESSIGNVEAHRDAPAASEVKVEVKREDPEEPPSQSSAKKDQKTKEFEAKRERHVKEEAMRREKTRDKTASAAAAASKDPPPPPPPVVKEESFIPVTKKKLEDTYARVKSDEKPKSSIGILAKFSYKKDKEKRAPDGSEVKDKDRLNRVKKSLSKGSGGLMERQKRTIKETVKAFAKTLGFGGKGGGAGGVSGGGAAAGASVSGGGGTRKMSASTTTSGSGEEEERKKKDDGPGVEKKRISSGSRREDLALTTTPPPPTRKSSCSGGEEGKSSGRSNSRNKARKPEDEGSSDTGGPGCISPGDAGDGGPLEIVSPHKCISVGDKLKVYYGPNHKSKVTYEAKVLQTREEDGAEREYLVHYTGWNTRYDEWIRRNRIAENLSWTPARSSKRIGSKVEAAAPQPGSSPATATPTTPSVQRSLETPSSGAMMKGKLTPRRSSTRTSTRSARANTDDSEESDKDSGSESETETESGGSPVNRSMRSRRILSDEDKKPPSLSSPSPGGSKTRSSRKCKTEDEEEEDKEKQQEPEEVKTPTHSTPTHSQEESRKSLRLSARKKQEAEHDKRLGPESDSDSETETERMTDDGMKAKVLEIIEPLDDVYEFKEPEPFNFKQKKTISPPSGPATAGKAPKKNIGLFEDYDNLEEDSEDPISAAIQRVMDTCSETQGEDMDLLDSNSGDSDISNDSSTMCEMMKKRLQSEINTYEGPKSKMKSSTRGGGDSGTPSMRTRRSSESKSTSKAVGSDEKTKAQQRHKTEKTSSESNEKLNETVKPDTDPGTAGKAKKPDVESSSKSKKTETDTSGSSRTKKSDVESNTSGKTKKSDDTTPTSSKTSKKPEQEKETPETASMKPRKLETPEGSMKTRLNRTEGNSSPGSKTRSKTEQLREEAEDMDEGKRPGASLVRTKTALSDSKGKTVLSFKKTVETAAVDHLKTSSLANKMVPDNAKVLEPKVLTFTSMSKVTQSENESTPTALSKMSSVHSIDKSKKDLSVSKVKSKLIPMASPSMVDVMKSSKSSTDFSAQTEPHVLGEKDKPVNIPSPSLLYPKLQKIECEPSTLVETKSTDIPVLQRIECVLPKTPIKRDVIDPSKIDLIKISPNMPQLEKIDTLDAGTVEKKDPTAGIAAAVTPGKAAESGETHREDLKFPSFKFDDVTETPEKVFTPAIDTETSSPIRIDKIEFKMKPKAPSPLGFGKTSTRKLVRQRIDEVKATTSAVVAKEKKSPQPQPQPIVKKYGPSSNMSVSDSTGSRVENQDTKDKLATVSVSLSPKQTVEGGSPVTLISKNKESTPTSSNKPNESPTTSILGKIKEIPSSILSKNKDNTPTLSSKAKDSPAIVPSKVKDSPAIVSNKGKDIPAASISSRKDNTPSVLNKIKDTTTPVSSKSRENPSSNVSNKCKDISAPVSSKIKETPTPPSSKIKDTPTSVANKIKEVASTPVSSKIKESPVLKQMKVILTPASSKVKDPSTPLSQKIRDVASPVSAKIKDTPVLNKSKDSSIDTSTIRENAPTDTSTVKFLLIGQIKENSSISLKGKEISPSPSLVGNKTKDATPTKSKGSTMMLLNLRKDTSALVGLSKNKDTAPNVAVKAAKDTLSILPSKKQDTTVVTPKPKNNKDSLLPSTSRQSESPTKDSARIGQSPPTLSETNKQTRCENESDEKSIDKASVESSTKVSEESSTNVSLVSSTKVSVVSSSKASVESTKVSDGSGTKVSVVSSPSSTKVSEESSTKVSVVSSSKASVEPSTKPSMESSTKVSEESSTKL